MENCLHFTFMCCAVFGVFERLKQVKDSYILEIFAFHKADMELGLVPKPLMERKFWFQLLIL